MEQTNQLAEEVIRDGQSVRPFYVYFIESYVQLKGKPLEFDGTTFTSEEEYYNHLIGVLEMLIKDVEYNEN
jgi:hypothetical protein